MRYVITYVNITKEKRYCYVIVILNIGLYLVLIAPSTIVLPLQLPGSLIGYCTDQTISTHSLSLSSAHLKLPLTF